MIGVIGECVILHVASFKKSICFHHRQRSSQYDPALQYTDARIFGQVSDLFCNSLLQADSVGMRVGPYMQVNFVRHLLA